jgi:hypothetical protein
MIDKPPWGDTAARVRWTNKRLDQKGGLRGLSKEHAARLAPESFAESSRRRLKWEREGGPELELARQGDIGPARDLVRKAFPLLADLVQLPPLARGQKRLPVIFDGETGTIDRPGVPYKDLLNEVEQKKRLADAVADVTRILRIWAAPEPDGYGRKYAVEKAAVEIAAERHSVDEGVLAERLKRASRPS